MNKETQVRTKPANTIQWLPDLNAAMKKARIEDKLVLLDFYIPT